MDVPRQEDWIGSLAGALGAIALGLADAATELRRANLIRTQSLFMEQLDRAIDDPVLAAALSTLDGLDEERRRQLLFINRHYGLLLLTYQIGAIDRGELLGSLKILSRNRIFRHYWQATADQRGDLPEHSLEARIGRALDAIVDERLDDLEEWWVVG
ncbi:DUF6082 family protein [Streptomyces sp. NPDC046716]|uniref:DUF6082 family protein n=1 Tax=Streptomyces sp. NPDC046716 TaxID=3157093 RepID=UPI0033DCCEA0